MIKVSVIVPVYNTSLYLSECLNSILSQTLKEIEIICINDGSTDNSLEIINQFALKDKRIIVIDKNNTGYGNTMNIGINAARGEYLGIVESDDFVSNSMYEDLYKLAKEYDVNIVKSNYYEVNKDKNIKFQYREALKNCKYDEVFSPMVNTEIFYAPLCIWSAIYKRSFIKDNNIKFNETKGASYQDISFNFKVLSLSQKVFLTKKAYLNYRRDSAFSSVNNVDKLYCVCDEYIEIEKFIDNNTTNKKKLYEIEIVLKVNSYIWNYYRLASAFQYTFLQRMIQDFTLDKKRGRLNKNFWDENLWQDIQEILEDGLKYFYRTSRDFKDTRVNEIMLPINLYICRQGLIKILNQYEHIIVYGAGILGKRVLQEFMESEEQVIVSEIAVSDTNGNPMSINNIPVYKIDQLVVYKNSSIVFVAVQEKNQYAIIRNLQLLGFEKIVTLQGEIRNCLFDERVKNVKML